MQRSSQLGCCLPHGYPYTLNMTQFHFGRGSSRSTVKQALGHLSHVGTPQRNDSKPLTAPC